MSRKDKPYLPLYVQDFMTDEKLRECSPASIGIYIMIMCVLHKSDPYGKILLRQKDKQKDKQILNFATKFAKHLPYSLDDICLGITELIDEGCLTLDGDSLYQNRMLNDGNLSVTRSISGKKGGDKTNKKEEKFGAAKSQANSDNEIDNDINTVLVKISTKIKSIGDVEVYVFNGCEAWQFREIEEMIKKGQREFEQIAMTKPLLNSKENFTTILQAFLDMIQSTGEYQTSSALKRHFGNWINKKNGSLELFLKECNNKTGKKQMPKVYL